MKMKNMLPSEANGHIFSQKFRLYAQKLIVVNNFRWISNVNP